MSDKWTLLADILGGIGLFLIGMIIMTEGLKQIAGKSIRTSLMAYTRSPYSGALWGAISTSILQSSSAVTVATVGFVRAGLMTFSHSLGVIFGANIGTTITGWLVLLLGFKLKLGAIVLPIIFCGALLRLFAKPQIAAIGFTIAGFGLIFTGITTLQDSMFGLREFFEFEHLSVNTLPEKLIVLCFGLVFTLITQSSSAGIAATLAALFSGLIEFEQAAILVIGMDIGTTFTALLATTGASISAKRTGYSHVIYNLLIGTSALFLIAPYIWLWENLTSDVIEQHKEIALVAFHSSFNTLGVLILLPFSQQFANLIEHLIKSENPSVLEQLDDSLLTQPSLALDLSLEPLKHQFISLLETCASLLHDNYLGQKSKLTKLHVEIDATLSFIEQIPVEDAQEPQRRRLVNLLHALDHLHRLLERCEEPPEYSFRKTDHTEIHEFPSRLIHDIKNLIVAIKTNQLMNGIKGINNISNELEINHQPFRKTILLKVTHQEFDIDHATKALAAFRWLIHISSHIERCASHLADASISAGN